ncbi:MAG: ATP-grasp domain-containing protein [Candidatus Hydrogenedens sp.]|nr:ATP-grasp domain-containing protein [Candidatus Hydrogenedens sp.]
MPGSDSGAVWLFGGTGDAQVLRVASALKALGSRLVLFDTAAFPEQERWSLSLDGLHVAGALVPWPRSVYVRGLACHALMPSLEETLLKHPRRVVAAMEEKRAFLHSLLLIARDRGALLVNSPEVNAQHSRKPYQLALFRTAQLPVPETLSTNDPDLLKAWLQDIGAAVYKPLAGGATVVRVSPEDVCEERLSALDAAPVLFQQLIEGVPVRVYVVGGAIVAAAEIHSKELDYRRGEEAVAPTQLTPEETDIAVRAAAATHMPFSGVDLIRAAGKTWLLECNPSPMFAAFELKTGLDVAGPLARLLAGAS